MYIERYEKNACSIYTMQKFAEKELEKVLFEAFCGVAFGINSNNESLCETTRKEFYGKVISASLVRKYLNEKNFDKIEKIVPKTTFDYLIANYNT